MGQHDIPVARVGERVSVKRSKDPHPETGTITSVDIGRNMLTVRLDRGEHEEIRVPPEQVALLQF